MRTFFIIALLALSGANLQAQRIGKRVKNQLFLQALQAECPQCVDKRGRLTPAVAEVDTLWINLENYQDGYWEWLFENNEDKNPISFQDFRKLKALTLRNRQLIYIKAWPPNLEDLDIDNTDFAEPMPLLPASLKKLSFDDYYSSPVGGEFDKKQFLYYPLPQGLEELSAENLGLEHIPPNLPNSLKILRLNGNKIEKIENLPPNLVELDLYQNQIRQLPKQWGDSLRILYLANNPIIQLPTEWGNCRLERLDLSFMQQTFAGRDTNSYQISLPASIKDFRLTNSYLVELKGEFPEGLELLSVSSNGLKKIPSLPKSLRYFYSESNKLDSLRLGHTQLKELSVEDNQLRYLDTLPASLEILSCGSNQLSSLPIAKNSQLVEIKCYNNQLSKLPQPLPSGLKLLYCANNQLKFLPPLPKGIEEVSFFGNPILAYPELPQGLKDLDKTHYKKE